jgi:hypothetical protein
LLGGLDTRELIRNGGYRKAFLGTPEEQIS